MVITNDTTIYLCAGVPFDSDYQHVRLFSNLNERLAYLNTLTVRSVSNCTYQRQNKYISFPVDYEELNTCDYLYFKNASDGKYYFAFIDNIEYANRNLSRVYFTIDYFQTWFGNASIKESFVLREHTNDDTFGKNLVDENLETGEYVYNRGLTSSGLALTELTPCIVMGVSEKLGDDSLSSHILDNTYTGLAYYYADMRVADRITDKLTQYADSGKADAVVSLFMYPKQLLSISEHVTGSGWLDDENTIALNVYSLDNPFAPLDGYTPKNNKLYTYPYRYLEICAPGSNANSYYYEYFKSFDYMFTVFSTLGGSAPIMAVPNNYKGTPHAIDEPVSLNPYPTCSWTNDNFKNWFAQNYASINYSLASNGIKSVANMITSAMAGDVGGVVSGGLSIADSVGNAMVTVHQRQIIPDSARGTTASANSFFANGQWYLNAIPRCIRYEYAKRIDDYFTFYGYATNEFKKPNITGRKSWNYVKLAECNIDLVAPIEAVNAIKNMFVRGVTIWHTNDIKNYNLDNSIEGD